MRNRLSIQMVLILFSTVSIQVMAETASPPGNIAYEDRIQFVETLLGKSSATKQVDDSKNPEAIARRDQARAHFEKAKEAHAAGDLDTANEELVQATKIMFEAVRLANQKEVTDEKKKQDYLNRLDSINALMEAHGRVSQEKGKQEEGLKLDRIVAEKVDEADALYKAGELDRARTVLDEAYIAAKVAINTLRSGDTLVRSLHFASKEEEYHYEIDRNDTHQMLLQMLMKEKMEAGPDPMVKGFIDKSGELRKQAEQQAGSGDFDTAIKTLEESTKFLVRALRGAGIYIPG